MIRVRWMAGVAAIVTVTLGMVAGCGQAEPPPLVPHQVASPSAADAAAPCSREAPVGAADSGPAPPGTVAVFDRAAQKIVLSAGTGVSLPALSRIVNDPAALTETAPGEWLLGVDLEIGPGASLAVTAPAVRRLALSSAPGRFVAIRVQGGKLAVAGSCVTSWDPAQRHADTDYADGRSFILARDGATMTVDHAEVRYLGYADVEAYGLAWRTAGTTGRVADSIISNLYFGVYTFEIGGMVVTGNEVYANVVYGIDPHTASHDMTITHNVVHDNGKHGIILAEDCVNNVISDNLVYANQQHGIVLFLRSDHNVVERNESFDNGSQGIDVNESGTDTISDNRVYANGESGIGIGEQAQGNVVERNDVRANQQDGVRLVTRSANTTVRDNIIGQNVRYGVYADVADPFTLTGNTIYSSRFGVAVSGGAAVPTETSNTMFGNTDGNIRDVG
jgi:parallel beta-helix repeat protein